MVSRWSHSTDWLSSWVPRASLFMTVQSWWHFHDAFWIGNRQSSFCNRHTCFVVEGVFFEWAKGLHGIHSKRVYLSRCSPIIVHRLKYLQWIDREISSWDKNCEFLRCQSVASTMIRFLPSAPPSSICVLTQQALSGLHCIKGFVSSISGLPSIPPNPLRSILRKAISDFPLLVAPNLESASALWLDSRRTWVIFTGTPFSLERDASWSRSLKRSALTTPRFFEVR